MDLQRSSLDETLVAARQRASAGDVDRAGKYFEEAIWKSEQHGLETQIHVLKEAIEFYASERIDLKLINACQRLLQITRSSWQDKDPRRLPYYDHLSRAYYRTRAGKELEEAIVKALEIERAVSGDRTLTYAKRLEYAANMFVDCGKRELAETLKGICRQIRQEISRTSAETPSTKPAAQLLVADRRVFLGLILTGAGIVPVTRFQEHLHASKQLGMHVGEVLVSAGLLSEEQLYTALQLQLYVRSNKLTMEKAIDAFAAACNENLPLEELIIRYDLSNFQLDDMDRLGRILESADLLTEERLEEALAKCREQKLPLARYLVKQKLVAPTVVAQALELQNYIRNGSISRDAAINKLKAAATGKKSTVLQLRRQ